MYEETRQLLAENEGKTIKIIGMISNVMWQHIQTYIDTHPNDYFFDLEDGYQVIIYSKDPISCSEKVEIRGKVIKVEGISYPDSKASGHSEYHIKVDTWKCI